MNFKQLYAALLLLSGLQGYAMDGYDYHEPQQKSVSYLWWPSGHWTGHAQLECNGRSWTSIATPDGVIHSSKKLAAQIAKATNDGQPMVRFLFEVNDRQQNTVEINIKKENAGRTCSSGALYPLQQAGLCSVPAPISLSPCLSASYLASGKLLGLNCVKNIEYYGNASLQDSMYKMVPGPATELSAVGAAAGMLALNIYAINSLLSDK